jgi:hypothetical protein
MVRGDLAPQVSITPGMDDDRLGADPFTRFLLDNPQAIPYIMSGLDDAVPGVIEGRVTEAPGDDQRRD